MRFAIIAVLALGLGASSYAEDGSTAAPKDVKAINTICPVSGEKVDSSIAPVEAKTTDGKTVEIGVCCANCPAAIKKHPEWYADAAVENKKYDGKDK
jgi:hypothetical protein